MKFASLLLAIAFGKAAARQAADLPIPAEEYSKYTCREECQKALKEAVPIDLYAAGKDFDFEFYATAANFSSNQPPGQILKFETLNANARNVSSGTSLYRMQYTSRDLDNSTVPVTGFIALPQVSFREPDGKFPVVAFAHGTIGLFRGCATSNGPNLYDYYSWQALVERGYAVVATDYAGLGNNYTTHKYVSHLAHANDIYYSVSAARQVLGKSLTTEWMSAGHSQGGGAVWKLAESALVRNDTGYRGTVAIAPATYIVDMFFANFNKNLPELLGYFPFFSFALERAIPGFKSLFVASPMQKRLDLAERTQVCVRGMAAMVSGLDKSEIVDFAGVEKNLKDMLSWQNRNSAALGDKSPAPVLVVQGLGDTSVLANTTREAWENSCKANNEVHLREYEDQEHSPVLEAASAEWLGWIDERFYGAKGAGSSRCSEKVRRLVAGSDTKTAPES